MVLLVWYFDIHNAGVRLSGTSDAPDLVLVGDEHTVVGILLVAEIASYRFCVKTILCTLSLHYNGILSFGVGFMLVTKNMCFLFFSTWKDL